METGEETSLDIDGAFIAIGHQPNSHLVDGQIDVDENGFVLTEGKSTRTNLKGVFAAGDLVDHVYRQAVTAAGTGCQAALDAEWYLRDRPPNPEDHWFAEDAYGASPAARPDAGVLGARRT
jgi:thioredoxin reductase (NADPH)